MKIFFDTEFYENGKTIQLISIGLIREDGVCYYAETPASRMLCEESNWLRDNVLPKLIGGDCIKTKFQIGEDLLAFVGEKPEFWAYYADYDWVVLCQIYGTMMHLPDGWPFWCRDVQQLREFLGNPKRPKQTGGEHNALDDAKYCKAIWEFLRDLPARAME